MIVDEREASTPRDKERSGVGISSAESWYIIMKAAAVANLAIIDETTPTVPAARRTDRVSDQGVLE